MARAGGDLRLPGDRGLRHDRGRAPDGLATRCRRAPRKPGTVGIAAGPEVAIMDEDGALLPPGEIGEVVIRGPNVTAGYENNPEANADGLHRRLVPHRRPGRAGRRRLSAPHRPAEGDHQPRRREDLARARSTRCCMDHPAVAQAVTFAMPHDKLGEEVAAAVVLREGSSADRARAARLRRRAARRLQGAAQGRDPRRDPEGRDRQAAAHRPGRRSSGLGVMRICIFGAGAIGGCSAAKLAAAGRTSIARSSRAARISRRSARTGLRARSRRRRDVAVPVRGHRRSRGARAAGLCGRWR